MKKEFPPDITPEEIAMSARLEEKARGLHHIDAEVARECFTDAYESFIREVLAKPAYELAREATRLTDEARLRDPLKFGIHPSPLKDKNQT